MYIFTDHNFDHRKIAMLEWILKDQVKKNAKNLWPFVTSCQENKYFLADRPDPKAKYQWMHTHPPIFNMTQWILALAGTLEIM